MQTPTRHDEQKASMCTQHPKRNGQSRRNAPATADERARIRALYLQGMAPEAIAAQLGIKAPTVSQTVEAIRDELRAGSDLLRNRAAALDRVATQHACTEATLQRLAQEKTQDEGDERIRRMVSLARGTDPGCQRAPGERERLILHYERQLAHLDEQAARLRGLLPNKGVSTKEEEQAQREAMYERRLNTIITIEEQKLPELPPELLEFEGLQ
jgi:hypothetical protein